METIQILVLALTQGITEFLPISSSAHLILVPVVFGWQDQGLAFDVAVHVGSLSAVMLYFRHEIQRMTKDWVQSLIQRENIGESALAWAVILGTIPAGLAGLLLNDFIALNLRSTLVIATTTIIFGLLLWYADARGDQSRTEHSLSLRDILIIGFMQALALIPGTSRSGITITAGLLLGLTRDAAARFSFLLSIPLILAGGGLKTKELVESTLPVDWQAILFGTLLSGVSAYFCIHFFLKLLDRIGMIPFIIYRLILGFVLFLAYLA
ncbi:MAG TPA: undecaprenyl-diphosphate phosphatase [Gammaproteobacteria bacterium]|nr:undecaprenyl-diphosphate phosphatase [Gammaproteobacteria bacterium]